MRVPVSSLFSSTSHHDTLNNVFGSSSRHCRKNQQRFMWHFPGFDSTISSVAMFAMDSPCRTRYNTFFIVGVYLVPESSFLQISFTVRTLLRTVVASDQDRNSTMMKRGAIILRRAQTSNLRRPFSFKPARAFSGATVSGDANVSSPSSNMPHYDHCFRHDE